VLRCGGAEVADKSIERSVADDVLAVVVARNGEDGRVVVLVRLVELVVVLVELTVVIDAVSDDVEERRLGAAPVPIDRSPSIPSATSC
jgi:hypothetical protein